MKTPKTLLDLARHERIDAGGVFPERARSGLQNKDYLADAAWCRDNLREGTNGFWLGQYYNALLQEQS